MEYIDYSRTSPRRGPNETLPPILALVTAVLALGAPALALGPGAGDSDSDSDQHVVVHRAVHVAECPDVKIFGAGGARVLSLSSRPFLGVEASNLTPELREHFGVPGDAGVMLSKIVDDSAAEAAGLAVGDIVTRVDGDEVTSSGRLGRAVREKEGGDAVEIEYWRDGEKYRTTATLKEREGCAVDIGDTLRAIRIEDLPAIGTLGIEIDGEALGATLEALGESLANQDWDAYLQGLEEIELEHIEERMERVQERLERLEERLERDYGRELERAERELERARERAERGRQRAVREQERERERAEQERQRAEQARERERERAEQARERAKREAERARAEADGGEGDGLF